jgi:hypothetical protein
MTIRILPRSTPWPAETRYTWYKVLETDDLVEYRQYPHQPLGNITFVLSLTFDLRSRQVVLALTLQVYRDGVGDPLTLTHDLHVGRPIPWALAVHLLGIDH